MTKSLEELNIGTYDNLHTVCLVADIEGKEYSVRL